MTKNNYKSILKVFFLFFIMFQCLISCKETTEIEHRLTEMKFNKIQGGELVDYDLIKETKGKVTIIDFWGPSCGPCIIFMQGLRGLQQKYPENLRVICVSKNRIEACKKFIQKDRFPFVFIHDVNNELSRIFPHTGIPYSVVIDQHGVIQEEASSSKLTLDFIEKLIVSQISPESRKTIQPQEDKRIPYISFEILSHDNSEIGHSVNSTIQKKISHINNDTIIDTIKTYQLTGHTIKQLYQHAFDVIDSRIIIKGDMPTLTSKKLEHLYDLNFTCSDRFFDYSEALSRHLNAAFGLSTRTYQKQMTYYELIDIKIIPDTIEILTNINSKSHGTGCVSETVILKRGNCSVRDITRMIEIFSQERNDNYPTISSLNGNYVLNIEISDRSTDEATWIKHFADNGLIIEKRQGSFDFVELSKPKE